MSVVDYSKFKIAKGFQHLDPKAWEANDISTGFSSIRMRGKAWSLVTGGKQYPFKRADDNTPLSYIDVIILGVNQYTSKTFFGPEEWTEDSTGGPICASIKGDVPDPGVSIPQAKTCGICPHNEWGSKKGGGKACQDHKRVAILLMPDMTKKMLGSPLMEPVFIKIPPGSFKTWKSYTDEMVHQGIPLAAVVTRMSFSPPPKTFELTFDLVQALTDKEVPVVIPMMESRETKSILGVMPQMKQVEQKRAAPEKIETGLLEAFGATDEEVDEEEAPPPKPAPKRRVVKTIDAAPPPPKEPDVNNNDGEAYEESDTDLDESVRSLMGDKMNKMLP